MVLVFTFALGGVGVISPEHYNGLVEYRDIHHVRSYVVNTAYLGVDFLEDVAWEGRNGVSTRHQKRC